MPAENELALSSGRSGEAEPGVFILYWVGGWVGRWVGLRRRRRLE